MDADRPEALQPPVPEADSAAPADRVSALILHLLEQPASRDALEGSLLRLAVHPEAAGFARAHLLVWNVRRERLDGWHLAIAEGGTVEGADPLRGVRSGEDAARLRGFREFAIAASRLDGVAERAWRSGAPTLGDGGEAELPWRGVSTVGAIPLRRGAGFYGLLVGEWDGPGDDTLRKAAIESLGRAAGAALDQFERAEELRRRAQRAAALAECARVAVSSHNLAEALHLSARLAAQITASRGSALWLLAADGALRLEVTHGPSGVRERLGRALQPLAATVVDEARPRLPARVTDEELLSPEIAAQISGLAIMPIVAYGTVLGAFAVYDRAIAHPADRAEYDPVDLEFLAALADLTALTVDQARRFDRLRRAEVQCRELRAHVRREERLASIGELAAHAAEEARNPLASIGAFARRVHRELPEDHAHREYLEIVIREADRLEQIVGGPIRHAAVEPLRLSVENLNGILQDVLRQSGEPLVRRRVRLLKKLAPDLPSLLVDPERIRQVMNNLMAHALESVPVGGRIRIESRRAGTYVIVDLAHDGPREPGDALEQLFVPFASSRHGGAGVALGIAQRIVHEHGGEIRVRSDAEWATLVSFTLPILENQDRRKTPVERRGARADRRRRYPEG